MRILSITAQKPDSTGSGVYLTALVEAFERAGHTQAVVAGIGKTDEVSLPVKVGFYPVRFETEELPFPVVGMSDEMPYRSTRYRDLTPERTEQFKQAFRGAVTQAVEELRPDLILCHHLYLLAALVRDWFPEYAVYGFCHNTDIRQMEKTDLERGFIAKQIRNLDGIFVPQQAQADRVREIYGVPGNRMTEVGTGYNSEIFHPFAPKKQDGIARLVFVGKIAEKKGVMSLLRALNYLEWPKDRLRLSLAGGAGDEEEYGKIRALAQDSPYPVEFLGRLSQEELAGVYNACDIFVLPSFFDAIPLTVIEALACRDRVVVTELPGIREWLAAHAPGGNIRYVALPPLRNTDEPVKEALPGFERRLARALEESLADPEESAADLRAISWNGIAGKVLEVCKR